MTLEVTTFGMGWVITVLGAIALVMVVKWFIDIWP